MMATMPMTIAPDAKNIASDCQKLKVVPKKARYSTMKANQPKNAATVPVTRTAKLFIMRILSEMLKSLAHITGKIRR